jgi:hypothetical protein
MSRLIIFEYLVAKYNLSWFQTTSDLNWVLLVLNTGLSCKNEYN